MPTAELLDMIGRLYDAALTPALWADALEKSSQFVGAPALARAVKDSHSLGDAAAALLSTTVAGATDPDVALDDDVRDRLALLAPHIRRAILIGKTIQLHRTKATSLADTFDAFTAGLFLTDATGRIIRANLSGQIMLDDESILRAAGGRLIACDAAADRALREIFAGSGHGERGPRPRCVAVPLPGKDGHHHYAQLLPLRSGTRPDDCAAHEAAIALCVRKAALDIPHAPDIIAELYGLTPTELRVLLTVFDSNGVADVASTLGMSQGTAKTHIRRLFNKTGTRRQADLVKLVAAFSGCGL